MDQTFICDNSQCKLRARRRPTRTGGERHAHHKCKIMMTYDDAYSMAGPSEGGGLEARVLPVKEF